MKRFRNFGYLALVLLTLAAPAGAIFVERFDPVWEEKKSGGEGFTDGTTGMEFVSVKGGCFMMGSSSGESNEKPAHEVCVDGFYLGKTEVTVGQFRKFVDAVGYQTEAEQSGGCFFWNGSSWNKDSNKNWRTPGYSQAENHPVVCVSWNDTKAFIDWSAKKNGKNLRLPTEVEWEYAARSGGKQEEYSGGDNSDAVAWYNDNSGGTTHPVGQKRANGLGLYDMSGNAWEWTNDWFGESYYGESPKRNPQGPVSGSWRVFRGGGWFSAPSNVRASVRYKHTTDFRGYDFGFRLAFSDRSEADGRR